MLVEIVVRMPAGIVRRHLHKMKDQVTTRRYPQVARVDDYSDPKRLTLYDQAGQKLATYNRADIEKYTVTDTEKETHGSAHS